MMRLSVIIITLSRPEYIRRCLEHLYDQVLAPDEIIVVDSSPDNHTAEVVSGFAQVLYLRNRRGAGRMTTSRNIGLKVSTGDIIAFLDDDAFAHPGWAHNLVATYTDLSTGAVGGRALRKQTDEESVGINEIGKLKSNGAVTGYFAADPGQIIEVDHVIGCNMSFRREVLVILGGFREEYTGTSVLEETDMCIRIKHLGYKILFNPLACVDHLGAPQVSGQRFDVRYSYYAQRNHLHFLFRNFGPTHKMIRNYLGYSLNTTTTDFFRRVGGAFLRVAAFSLGTLVGTATGTRQFLRTGTNPIDQDKQGRAIAEALLRNAGTAVVVDTAIAPETVVKRRLES